jgi:hypothetical protein
MVIIIVCGRNWNWFLGAMAIMDNRQECVPSVSYAWQVLSDDSNWRNVKFW